MQKLQSDGTGWARDHVRFSQLGGSIDESYFPMHEHMPGTTMAPPVSTCSDASTASHLTVELSFAACDPLASLNAIDARSSSRLLSMAA
jgi:hypothetical protein